MGKQANISEEAALNILEAISSLTRTVTDLQGRVSELENTIETILKGTSRR